MSLARAFLPVALAMFICCTAARGEVLVLETGGRVVGKLLNPKESPREKYVVEVLGGSRITLEKAQVKQVVRPTAAEVDYEKVRHQYPDTVEGQMELASWCRDHHLETLRRQHLERVLEIDPGFNEAHRLLKHVRVGGVWKTPRQFWEDQGYVLYQGRWMTPQEVELRDSSRKIELAALEWRRRLKHWRIWLDTGREEEALEQIDHIDDPLAVPALGDLLGKEGVESYRKRYIETLARIASPAAWHVLLRSSLYDESEEVRLTSLDYIIDRPSSDVVEFYVKRLRDENNTTVNRAALALGRLKDRKAVQPLIDALVTSHKRVVAPANPGGFAAGFGSVGGGPVSGGMNVGGGGAKILIEYYRNEDVLEALAQMTGQNYEYSVPAWKNWYASQKKSLSLNARRD